MDVLFPSLSQDRPTAEGVVSTWFVTETEGQFPAKTTHATSHSARPSLSAWRLSNDPRRPTANTDPGARRWARPQAQENNEQWRRVWEVSAEQPQDDSSALLGWDLGRQV
jgi:hypothetical protein